MALARPCLESYFDYKKPSLPSVKNLTAPVARQIVACQDAGYRWADIDRYLGKTLGTTARWNGEERYDKLIKEENQRMRAERVNARREIRSGVVIQDPAMLAEAAKRLSDDDFNTMTSLLIRGSSASRRETVYEQTMVYLPELKQKQNKLKKDYKDVVNRYKSLKRSYNNKVLNLEEQIARLEEKNTILQNRLSDAEMSLVVKNAFDKLDGHRFNEDFDCADSGDGY